MNTIGSVLLKAFGDVLKKTAGTIYDIIIYPAGLAVYNLIYHTPIIGPALTETIDYILERLSQDWTPAGFGTETEGNDGNAS